MRWTRTDHLTSANSNLVVEIVHQTLQRFGDGLGGVLCAFKLLDSLAQFVYLTGHGCQSFRERIVDLLGIGDDDTLAFAEPMGSPC